MPQLVKGGKWVFGWSVASAGREVAIPPAAWDEYGFRIGDEVIFIAGSRRSGGFGLSHERLVAGTQVPLAMRAVARGQVSALGVVTVPIEVGVQPGDRLLVVRGSGRALGFIAQGPIYDEALRHTGLECFRLDLAG